MQCNFIPSLSLSLPFSPSLSLMRETLCMHCAKLISIKELKKAIEWRSGGQVRGVGIPWNEQLVCFDITSLQLHVRRALLVPQHMYSVETLCKLPTKVFPLPPPLSYLANFLFVQKENMCFFSFLSFLFFPFLASLSLSSFGQSRN